MQVILGLHIIGLDLNDLTICTCVDTAWLSISIGYQTTTKLVYLMQAIKSFMLALFIIKYRFEVFHYIFLSIIALSSIVISWQTNP